MTAAFLARFWSRVERTNGCWIWKGSAFKRAGYGQCYFNGRPHGAHRIAWLIQNGTYPAGMVLHRCDNRLCVNPDHLFLGNAATNHADARSKGRHSHGEKHGNSRLTAGEVRQIVAAWAGKKERVRVIAARFGVSLQTVEAIIYGRNWGHVTGLGR